MNNRYLYYIVSLLLLAFPSLCNLVRHSGSAVLILLTLMGMAILMSHDRRPSLTRDEKWVMWAFAAYFGVYLLSFVINGLLGDLPDPRFKYLDHEFRFLLVFPIFLLLRHLKIQTGILWHGVNIGALVAGGYAFCSYFLLAPGDRIKGAYHAIAFGDLSLALAFMSIVSVDWYRRNRSVYVCFPVVASLFGISASIMSGTRGAWIALPGLMCILFLYSSRFIRIGPRLVMVALFCFLAVAAYKIPATKIEDRLGRMFTGVVNYTQGQRSDRPTAERIEGWKAAIHIFRQNPVFGAGPGNFVPLANELVEKKIVHKSAAKHSKPHSSYLMVMSDCGLLGLIAMLGLLGMPLKFAVDHIKSHQKAWGLGFAMVLVVVSYAHFALTEAIFSRNVNISFYVIMVAFLMATMANERTAVRQSNDPTPDSGNKGKKI